MRILTGIQPSGKLHWGNYFGAMKSMFDLQAKGEDMFMFIANFHAMTTVRDGAELRAATREVALDYLACGLDPAKTIVYRQSDVPEVQELAWYLSCLTPMGLLERCHSYKDKMAHGFDATHGLFAYPVLMAADILIMQSDLVPVGKDQKQHLEVTRDLAIKFNNGDGHRDGLEDDGGAEGAGGQLDLRALQALRDGGGGRADGRELPRRQLRLRPREEGASRGVPPPLRPV